MAEEVRLVTLDAFRKKDEGTSTAKAVQSPLVADGGGPHDSDMSLNERIARLEGSMDGLRHSQNMTLAAVVGVGALLFGLMIYGLQRVDSLPGEIRAIADSIAATVTATRAVDQRPQQPIIIQVPAQQAAPAGTSPPKP